MIKSDSPPDSITVSNDSNDINMNQTISSLSMSSNSSLSGITKKRKEMSSSRKFLLNQSIKSRNPKHLQMFCANYDHQKGNQVKARLIMHYRRYMSRKRLEGRQQYRKMLINDLRKKLASDSLKLLIVNGADQEVMKGISNYQRRKVEEQGKHILKALEMMDQHENVEVNVAWEECCDKACDEMLSNYSGRTISSWFRTYKLNNMLLPLSKIGFHQVTKDLNPFLEYAYEAKGVTLRDNEDLCKELRCWALEKLEELNLDIITNKVNEILKEPIQQDTAFLQQYHITYPIKSSSVRRWMTDLKFVYCPVKKSYMINTHERDDVKKTGKNTLVITLKKN